MLGVIIGVTVTGCVGMSPTRKSYVEEKEKKLKIGFSVSSLVLERWQRDRDIFTATAKNLGADVNVQNANGSTKEQMDQIEYFIQQKMDVIVIIPEDCGALTKVVKKAKNAGIPVISYDRLIENADVDLYISFDNQAVGELMAEELIHTIPSGGNIFMIQGPLEDNNVKQVKEGFEKRIQSSSLKVVYESNCKGWISENAVDSIKEALKKYPDVDGIMCGNDELAGKVFQLLAERQLVGKVSIVGQDGDLSACQRIVEGFQTMTAFKDIDQLAQTVAEYAIKIGEGKVGKDDPFVKDTIDDGSYEVPYLKLPVVAVTKKNIDKVIIERGFHLKEDVYLNVKKKK